MGEFLAFAAVVAIAVAVVAVSVMMVPFIIGIVVAWGLWKLGVPMLAAVGVGLVVTIAGCKLVQTVADKQRAKRLDSRPTPSNE